MLARRFLAQVADELGLEEKHFRPETITILEGLPWPGNVRQLQNLCRQLFVMALGEQIFPEDVPREIVDQEASRDPADQWPDLLRKWARSELAVGGTDLVGRAQAELESVLIDCALEQTGGQRQKAAGLLGLGRNTLTRKIQKINSQREPPAARR